MPIVSSGFENNYITRVNEKWLLHNFFQASITSDSLHLQAVTVYGSCHTWLFYRKLVPGGHQEEQGSHI